MNEFEPRTAGSLLTETCNLLSDQCLKVNFLPWMEEKVGYLVRRWASPELALCRGVFNGYLLASSEDCNLESRC